MWNEWQADEWMDRHCGLTDKLFDGGRWSQMKKKILSANHAYNFCTLGTGCMATAVVWTFICKIYCRGGPDLNRNILFMTNDWQIDVFVFQNHMRACAQSYAKKPQYSKCKTPKWKSVSSPLSVRFSDWLSTDEYWWIDQLRCFFSFLEKQKWIWIWIEYFLHF